VCCGARLEVPGQELGDAVDGVFGNALDYVTEIDLRVEAIEAGGGD